MSKKRQAGPSSSQPAPKKTRMAAEDPFNTVDMLMAGSYPTLEDEAKTWGNFFLYLKPRINLK